MRILLQLGAARPADQGALPPLAAALLSALREEDTGVTYSRELLPDLSIYDVVHLLATPPYARVARQFIHARRWGKPLLVSMLPPYQPDSREHAGHLSWHYEDALCSLVLDGAERIVALTEADTTPRTRPAFHRPMTLARWDDPTIGKTLLELYEVSVRERAEMDDEDSATHAGQWLPGIPAEEYCRHLEDLCQLQLELIAYRDAEYDQLRRQLGEARAIEGDSGGGGHRALKYEYERLGVWSRDLETRHEALQADYARLQRWAADLETQLQSSRHTGLRATFARLLRRRT